MLRGGSPPVTVARRRSRAREDSEGSVGSLSQVKDMVAIVPTQQRTMMVQ
jgi:hypothetical protein